MLPLGVQSSCISMEDARRRPAKCNYKSGLMSSHQSQRRSSRKPMTPQNPTASQIQCANLESNCPRGQQSPKDACMTRFSKEGKTRRSNRKGNETTGRKTRETTQRHKCAEVKKSEEESELIQILSKFFLCSPWPKHNQVLKNIMSIVS